jgi:hypothetical protein
LELNKSSGVHLRISGVNLTRHRIAHFDHIYTPNMPVHVALAICMNDPFHDPPVSYQGEEFTSAWVENCALSIFEDYTDHTVIVCLMNKQAPKNVPLLFSTNKRFGEPSNVRRSFDAIADASRKELADTRWLGNPLCTVYCIDDVDCSMSQSDDELFEWTYNVGYNGVSRQRPQHHSSSTGTLNALDNVA